MNEEVKELLLTSAETLNQTVGRLASGDERLMEVVRAVQQLHRAVWILADTTQQFGNRDSVIR